MGRRRETVEVRRLLRAARLVTLTGIGGSGKTRLAAAVAEKFGGPFAERVWLVDLTALADSDLLDYQIATVLGVQDRSGRGMRQVVLDHVRERGLLLVLDGCEHLVDACAAFAVDVLRSAPRVRVLCTSRQPLGVIGEHVFLVEPLAVPPDRVGFSGDVAIRFPALALFVERARAVDPMFTMSADSYEAIADVCRRLDGLPLALELAASALRVESIDQLAAGLPARLYLLSRDASPARHRTLRAAFDWSFRLCSPAERTLWTRVSVFGGSFDVAAAEQVCGDSRLLGEEVLDAVVGLIDKSVICAVRDDDGIRYRLLDTVREYGLDRLRSAGDAAGPDESELRRCHAEYYLDLAERFHDGWFGPDQPQWSRRMRDELPNLRSVLAYHLAGGRQPRSALALAGALYYFWYACGVAREGRYWLHRALDADTHPSPQRTRALAALAWLLLVQNAPDAAAGRARECLDLADRFDQPDYRVDALQSLGLSLLYQGESELGMSLLERAAADARHLELNQPALAVAQQHLAVGMMFRGETARADAMLTEVIQICRSRGERWWLGRSLLVAIAAGLTLGDPIRAADYARETLQAAYTLGDQLSLGAGLEFMAWTVGAQDDHRCAARLLGAADRQWRTLGGSPIDAKPWKQGHTVCEAVARQSLGGPVYSAEFHRGQRLTLTEAVGYALQRRVGQAEPVSPAD